MQKTNSLKSVLLFLVLFLNFHSSFSQEITQSIALKPYSKVYAVTNNIVIKNAILEDGKYTYKFKERNILIEIKNGFYYEYHPKREFIKAKITWVSEYKYKLTIVDLEKRGAPFKVGSELTSEIIRVKGDKYYYLSVFNGKRANGSFKKLE